MMPRMCFMTYEGANDEYPSDLRMETSTNSLEKGESTYVLPGVVEMVLWIWKVEAVWQLGTDDLACNTSVASVVCRNSNDLLIANGFDSLRAIE